MSTASQTLNPGNATVAELAVSHPAALGVFTKYNIDYCCGGHRSFDEACTRQGLNTDAIWREIESAPERDNNLPPRVEQWSASLLSDYITENHHRYVRSAIPEIEALLEKVCDAHGADTIELYNIQQDFADLAEELLNHMEKEERSVFPALKKLEAYKGDHPLAENLQTPISLMEHEHTIAGDLVKSIRTLSGGYTPPEDACPTFRITYQKLKEFDDDLMLHIHLENNILFRKV